MVAQPRRPRNKQEPSSSSSWRAMLLKERDREIDWVLKIQSYRTPFLDHYFRIASMLGEELFYILFLPLSAWAVSSQFTVHLTMLLAMSVGIGNILKNFFLIPRPPHPPVWVHTATETDHGLPSTHTMTAITLPWYFIIFHTYLEPIYPLHPLVSVIGVVWTVSVVMSRLYNGHHTPLDVAAGGVLGIAFLVSWTLQLRPFVDSFLINGNLAGVATIIGATVSVLVLHPIPPKILTPAHAETGLVAGTATGAFLGLWIRASYNPRSLYTLFNPGYPLPHFPFLVAYPFLTFSLRFVVGAVLVIATRFIIKKLAIQLVLSIASIFTSKYITKSALRHSEAECAIKYITYTAIGCTTTWLAPVVFSFIGLHMPVDDVILLKY